MDQPVQFIPSQRRLFSIPEAVTYFNCAYLSPLFEDALKAGELGLRRKTTPWEVFPDDFFEESDRLRELFARLIGARGKDISILPSVSYGMAVAAKNLPCPPGSRILTLAEQFPSNVYIWRHLARENGAEVHAVPRPGNDDWSGAVLERLDETIAFAALPHCHWADGCMLDLKAISEKCRRLEIPLVLDVTQSLGVVHLDVETIQPAFLVASCYKWLLGPYSLAYMYVNPAYHRGDPLEYNWMARVGSRNFSGLVNYTDEMAADASRFDVGERSNFILLPMAIAALERILAWGVDRIEATLAAYNRKIIDRARAMGFRALSPPHGSPHLIGLRSPDPLPVDLTSRLVQKNVYVSVRGDAIRVAPYLYNDERDMDRFFDALKFCL